MTTGVRTSLGRARRRALAFLERFRRDGRGATAVEFSMVALPLIFLLFSLLELAIIFLISTTLENATYNAARTIRTGQMQTSGSPTAAQLKTSICNNLSWLGSACTTNVEVDVRTYANFTNPTIPDPIKNGAFDPLQMRFDTGNAGDIVLVRAFYKWTLVTPFLAGGMQRLNNGVTVLTASSLFKNEPYS